jgi:hypothetical protein
MTNLANAFQPAIDALEKDLADLERQGNALLTSINLLREKAGLPPRPGNFNAGKAEAGASQTGGSIKLHSDTFTGMKLASAVRSYLEMRKQSGGDAPATTREIFDALKEGGFVSNAKDEAIGMVVLRTMLRKNTTAFAKLQNGKYGLRAWYGNLKPPKAAPAADSNDEDEEEPDIIEVDQKGTATPKKATA